MLTLKNNDFKRKIFEIDLIVEFWAYVFFPKCLCFYTCFRRLFEFEIFFRIFRNPLTLGGEILFGPSLLNKPVDREKILGK